MTREQKSTVIEELAGRLNETNHFYLADISTLNAADTSALRRKCHENKIQLLVVKNTLLKKAMEKADAEYDELFGVLKDPTSIIFSEVGNVPAKLIKEFRKKHDRPVLKAAYVEEGFYIGDEMLETLASLKSKDELVADIIALLQSPVKTVISQLQSGGQTLTGVLTTLSEKEN